MELREISLAGYLLDSIGVYISCHACMHLYIHRRVLPCRRRYSGVLICRTRCVCVIIYIFVCISVCPGDFYSTTTTYCYILLHIEFSMFSYLYYCCFSSLLF
jgi:hypothetical protein